MLQGNLLCMFFAVSYGFRMAVAQRSPRRAWLSENWFRLGKTDMAEHIFGTMMPTNWEQMYNFQNPKPGLILSLCLLLLDALPNLLIGPRTGG